MSEPISDAGAAFGKAIATEIALLRADIDAVKKQIIQNNREIEARDRAMRDHMDERDQAMRAHIEARLAVERVHIDERFAAERIHIDERFAAERAYLNTRLAELEDRLNAKLAVERAHNDERHEVVNGKLDLILHHLGIRRAATR